MSSPGGKAPRAWKVLKKKGQKKSRCRKPHALIKEHPKRYAQFNVVYLPHDGRKNFFETFFLLDCDYLEAWEEHEGDEEGRSHATAVVRLGLDKLPPKTRTIEYYRQYLRRNLNDAGCTYLHRYLRERSDCESLEMDDPAALNDRVSFLKRNAQPWEEALTSTLKYPSHEHVDNEYSTEVYAKFCRRYCSIWRENDTHELGMCRKNLWVVQEMW